MHVHTNFFQNKTTYELKANRCYHALSDFSSIAGLLVLFNCILAIVFTKTEVFLQSKNLTMSMKVQFFNPTLPRPLT